jgi:hypothetical protein
MPVKLKRSIVRDHSVCGSGPIGAEHPDPAVKSASDQAAIRHLRILALERLRFQKS